MSRHLTAVLVVVALLVAPSSAIARQDASKLRLRGVMVGSDLAGSTITLQVLGRPAEPGPDDPSEEVLKVAPRAWREASRLPPGTSVLVECRASGQGPLEVTRIRDLDKAAANEGFAQGLVLTGLAVSLLVEVVKGVAGALR